jgi:adenosylhomocysteine nucleosidase
LKREAAILAGPGRMTICGDASTLSAGLALDPRLRPGDLVVGAEVVSDDGSIRTDEAVASSLERLLTDAGARVVVDRLAAANAPVLTAGAKAELRNATRAAAVDMESLTAARYALERKSPFAILRAVADPADRDLPPLVLKAVDSDGRINFAGLILELTRSPGQFAGLRAAARDSQAAFRALTRSSSLLAGLFLSLGPAHL